MRRSTRRWLTGLVITAVMATGLNTIIGAQSAQAVAGGWALGLNHDQKLQAFKHIEMLHGEYQKALFRVMDFNTVKTGMIERLERAQRSKRWQTPEQQALIAEIIEQWRNMEWVSAEVNEARAAAITPTLIPRVRAVLGRDFEGLFHFYDGQLLTKASVDDAREQVAQVLPVSVRVKQMFTDAQTLFARQTGGCNCSTNGGGCDNSSNGGGYANCSGQGWQCNEGQQYPDCTENGGQSPCQFGCTALGGTLHCNSRCSWQQDPDEH
jgi:hypothetical protein